MRNILLTFIFLLSIPSIYAQEYYDLPGLQGLRDKNGNVFFEISGYEITVTSISGKVNDKAISDSLREKYGLKTILAEYSDEEVPSENKIIEAETNVQGKPGEKINQALYIIAKNEGVLSIYFHTFNQRDIVLEQVFVDAYIEDQLQEYISDDWNTQTIKILEQNIQLESDCKWIMPHNVQCGNAQIMWTEYSAYESALLDINTRIRLDDNDRVSIVSENEVEILFRDIPGVAHRIVYKKRNEEGGSNLFACYYIAQEIDGRYASCVLSNPVQNDKDYTLDPLLKHIINIPEIPEEVYDSDDEEDANADSGRDNSSSDMTMIEIQAGMWLPVGKLSNVFGYAPSIGLYVGIPIKKRMAIDIGFQLAIPRDKQLFDYYHQKNNSNKTESELLVNVALRWRQQHEIRKNIYLSTYIGAGLNLIRTDLIREYYEDQSDKYETIETMDVFGGARIRYKVFGAFMEYHFTPYSIANKVKGHLGNSSLNIGLSFSFISF